MRFIERDDKGFIKPGCLEAVFRNIKEKTEYDFAHNVKNEIFYFADNQQLSVKILFEHLVRGLLLKQIEADALPKILWVEKTPGHIFQLDIIHDLYPQARFIEIIRNPLNAIYSCKTRFDDIDHITPSALAHRWRSSVNTFQRFSKKNPEKTYSVKYEDLVNDPEGEFRKIANFLSINPDIEKLSDIQKIAGQLVLKRETWKKNNLNNGITEIGTNYKWALNEKLKIRYLLREELKGMRYSNGYSLSQALFNGWMDFISKFANVKSRYLSPIKKSTKYFVKKAGLWPYQK